MATVKPSYAASADITPAALASLAATAACQTAAQDNSTNLYLDALVQVKLVMGGTGPANDKVAYVYAFASGDEGTTYGDATTGSAGAITLNSPTQLRLIGVVNMPTASLTYESDPMSVAAAYGGVLPRNWGIVVQNSSSVLAASGSAITFQGLAVTVV